MVLLLPVLIGSALGLIEGATINYYATKYDHIDVDTILNNRRMVNYYAACMLSNGPCPPEGVEFKRILPDALRTNCERCTEKQKTVTLRAIRRLKKEYPKIWVQLSDQWDPDGIYIDKFESTFGGKQSVASTPEVTVQIGNRFKEPDTTEKAIQNAINEIFTPNTTTGSTSSTTNATSTTSTSSRTTAKISTAATTNNPNINTITVTAAKPTKRPRPGIGASIQATVNMVKSIEKLIGEIAQEKLEFLSRFLTG